MLKFEEQEPGNVPAVTRLLVTPSYLRVDDGKDSQDFLLFDRKEQTIYSVSSIDRSVLVIKPTKRPESSAVKLEEKIIEGSDRPPAIGARPVHHYLLFTNGTLCYDVYAAEGLLPEAVSAWREYRETLAREQARTLAWTPSEIQTPCMLANNIYSPARHLAHGLPVRFRDADGKLSQLVDYQGDADVKPMLFRLPPEYPRVSIDTLRKGGS